MKGAETKRKKAPRPVWQTVLMWVFFPVGLFVLLLGSVARRYRTDITTKTTVINTAVFAAFMAISAVVVILIVALTPGVPVEAKVRVIVVSVLLSLGFSALFAAACTLTARTMLSPLKGMTERIEKITVEDMSARLDPVDTQDELNELSVRINSMLDGLQEAFDRQSNFISDASHELRTPLTSIKGWVETIANIRDPDDENYRKGITIIRSETDRLYDMVEELLDFSRLQNGIKLNCEVLDFVAEATDAALFVEPRIRQEGLHLVYDEPPEPYPVWADPARLRQVFVNVFDNAIKYSPPEGTIFFTLTRTATTVTASIRDQGRGIAPDDLQNVKMKFFKAKNAVRGSGIGLAVVDEITKALGGTADITSTLGQGTTVTITLPIYHAGQEHLHEPL